MLWIESDQGYVPYTYIDYQGQWERVISHTIFPPDQSVTLRWTGKVGNTAEIAFRKTDYSQPVSITWNGENNTYDLNQSIGADVVLKTDFQIPGIFTVPFLVFFAIISFFALFSFLIIIGSFRIKQKAPTRRNPHAWLFFMLPMLIVWMVVLLTLWPGVLTNDSLSIWKQAETGQIGDWQSAFHTFLISLLIKLIPSPAFILSIQIILLAFVTARGLKFLEIHGVPHFILWGISFLMALFPPNLLFTVTLWKDIPYAIALLALTVILLEIAASRGAWGSKKFRWIALAAVAFCVSVLRHNGAPVALLTLIILPIIFRKYWKSYSAALILGITTYLILQGPVYDRITVDNSDTGQSNLTYLHHIAAHVDAGTHLTTSERAYLNDFLPLENWDYTCCYVGNISYDPDLERSAFLSNTPRNRKLAFDLFRRDPLVDISHAFCAGEISFKFLNNQQCTHIKSVHGFINIRQGSESWIGTNTSCLHEASQLPNLLQPLIHFLRLFGVFASNPVFYLRPAFWLFIAFLSLAVLAIRFADPGFFVPLIPALGQSLLLFLIAFAPAYRYYYSNCLVGIFLLGCLFMPAPEKEPPTAM